MTIKVFNFAAFVKPITFIATFFLSTIAINAQAVFIDFDDLTYIPEYPEWPFFADTPVTDQYLSQGLLVAEGFLYPYASETDPNFISGPNYLLGGTSLGLNFVGENLPTYVGMYVESAGEAIFLEAYGTSGLLFSTYTAGDGGPFFSAPYTPKQYISFESVEGIKSIQMSGFYGSRTSAHIDDLTFTYADVPEPSTFMLLLLGIAVLIYRGIKPRE